METLSKLQKNEWIRFQVPDKRVLEGFVQEISPDEARVLIGKAPDSPENEWHAIAGITVLKTQEINASV